jgi:peptidoglycan/LPS O-acetylase OafA/YrhL
VRISYHDTTRYRADIDGLRAVSILLVVGFHAHPWLIPGGFIGVDIFFVISGFLITGIILTEIDGGTFSPIAFYARRVRRIFPALIVVLLATYLVGWFLLLPDAYILLGKNIAAGVAFASNLLQLSQAGYFAPDAAENPLLHLWSLGIEEQFYIVWPAVLLLIAQSNRRQLYIGGIAAVSLCAALLIFLGYKQWSFYAPIPRAWELLIGALLAERQIHQTSKRKFSYNGNLTAIAGIALIGAAAMGLNSKSAFPGVYALLPTVGAALIIGSPNAWVNRLLLANRPMVFIGLISYPLYLWHWPILTYLSILQNGVPNFLEIWAAVALAVMLSWLTFRFVEKPIRRKPGIVPRLAFSLMGLGAVGIVTAAASGFDGRFSPEIRAIAQLAPQNNAGLRNRCFLEGPGSKLDSNCIEPGDKRLLFLWGDSTAAALYPGLKKAEETDPFRLALFGAPGCAPILATGSNGTCDEINATIFDYVKSSRPGIVLLHAMWDKENDLGRLGETVRQLKALGVPRIVILGPVPVWKRTLPHSLVNVYRFSHVIPDRIATGVSGPERDGIMEAFSRAAGVDYISARQILCNSDGCLTRIGPTADDVVATDIVHLSEAGSRYLIDAIAGRLLSPGHGGAG